LARIKPRAYPKVFCFEIVNFSYNNRWATWPEGVNIDIPVILTPLMGLDFGHDGHDNITVF